MHRRGSPGSDPQAPSQGAFSHTVPPCPARPRHWSQREGRQPPCPGESGPTRAQANIWLGGGKEPKEAPVGSYLSSPSSPQEGALQAPARRPQLARVAARLRPPAVSCPQQEMHVTGSWDPRPPCRGCFHGRDDAGLRARSSGPPAQVRDASLTRWPHRARGVGAQPALSDPQGAGWPGDVGLGRSLFPPPALCVLGI